MVYIPKKLKNIIIVPKKNLDELQMMYFKEYAEKKSIAVAVFMTPFVGLAFYYSDVLGVMTSILFPADDEAVQHRVQRTLR